MLTDIWCRFFEDASDNDMKEKLEILRPLVKVSSPEDITIFNYWAKKRAFLRLNNSNYTKDLAFRQQK